MDKPWLEGEFTGPDPRWLARVEPLLGVLRAYHRHEVRGFEGFPDGPVLVVVHHSLATYDAFLFCQYVFHHQSRVIGGLADDQLFAWPFVRRMSKRLGMLPANHEHGQQLLEQGVVCFVAPGGMREALRPSSERRTMRWGSRKGFVRLAMRAGATIVPVACPAADDLYTVYENPVTKLVYKNFRFPVPVVRGLGLTAIPRPVKLVHHVGAPIVVEQTAEPAEDVVDAVHGQVCDAVQGLLQRR